MEQAHTAISRDLLRRARQRGEHRIALVRLVVLSLAVVAVASFVPLVDSGDRVVQERAVIVLAVATLWSAIWLLLLRRIGSSRWCAYVSSSLDLLTAAAVAYNWSIFPGPEVLPTQIKYAVGFGMHLIAIVLTAVRFDWRPVLLVTGEALLAYAGLVVLVLTVGDVELTFATSESFAPDRVNTVDMCGRLMVLGFTGALMTYLIYLAERLVRQTGHVTALKEQLRQFVSTNVAEEIESGRATLDLSGHRRRITIMFCDIRGFTTLSEKLEPEAVLSLLNRYYERVAAEIFSHQGTLDKYVGDGVMALFGAPTPLPSSSLAAVRCAMAMQKQIRTLTEAGEEPLRVGIGLHTAEVVVGNLGTDAYKNYTAIGAGVNLAARIEGATARCEASILFSEEVAEEVRAALTVEEVQTLELKGVAEPVKLYTVREGPSVDD